jgi:hypothetical protein
MGYGNATGALLFQRLTGTPMGATGAISYE